MCVKVRSELYTFYFRMLWLSKFPPMLGYYLPAAIACLNVYDGIVHLNVCVVYVVSSKCLLTKSLWAAYSQQMGFSFVVVLEPVRSIGNCLPSNLPKE